MMGVEIPICEEIKRFETHLDITNNNRIIFSGQFGSGKTYFLNSFFKEKEAYKIIKINPVNYSINSNGDIINYIRYDILLNLISQGLINVNTIDKQAFPYSELTKKEFILDILRMVPVIGPITGAINYLSSLGDKLVTLYNNAQESNEINNFIKIIEMGCVNPIDEIISRSVDNKNLILLIDDLDRIDPEHIFRILNVFAAHIDFVTEKNKYGFDKIILVCDINNIKCVFHHKYGANSDFKGYINKFFSKYVYDFDNKNNIIEYIPRILNNIAPNYICKSGTTIPTPLGEVIQHFINELLKEDLFNIRDIIRFKEFNFENYQLNHKGRHYGSQNSAFLLFNNFFSSLFGHCELFIDKLRILKDRERIVKASSPYAVIMHDVLKYSAINDGYDIYSNCIFRFNDDNVLTGIYNLDNQNIEMVNIPDFYNLLFDAVQKIYFLNKTYS